MGRPSDNTTVKNPHPTPGYREFNDGASTSSAISLQEDIAHLGPLDGDNEDEDEALPPPYTDEESNPLISATPHAPTTPSTQPPETLDMDIQDWTVSDWKGSRYTRLSPSMTTDPVALEKYITWSCAQIPKGYIRIQGYHSEKRRDHDGKNKRTERVDDFDFKADVTETFATGTSAWRSTVMVEDTEKTYRGSRLKKRSQRRAKPENSEAPTLRPSLTEWCHLFCASRTPLKTFTLRRAVVGRDEKYLTQQITAILRETNYRGNIVVTFPLHHRSVTIISPHWMNRLRHNNWVWWICVILQLWIILWPVLFFMTKRWEIVRSEYFYSMTDELARQYYKESEEAWCLRWKYAIQQSALSRVKCPHSPEVIVAVTAEQESQRRQAEELAQRNLEQQNGFVGGALALMRGASSIHRDLNASVGWGYDV